MCINEYNWESLFEELNGMSGRRRRQERGRVEKKKKGGRIILCLFECVSSLLLCRVYFSSRVVSSHLCLHVFIFFYSHFTFHFCVCFVFFFFFALSPHRFPNYFQVWKCATQRIKLLVDIRRLCGQGMT